MYICIYTYILRRSWWVPRPITSCVCVCVCVCVYVFVYITHIHMHIHIAQKLVGALQQVLAAAKADDLIKTGSVSGLKRDELLVYAPLSL